MDTISELPEALKTLCLRYHIMPVELSDKVLVVAGQQPLTAEQRNGLRFVSGKEISIVMWPETKLQLALQRLANGAVSCTAEKNVNPTSVREQTEQYVVDDTDDEPVVKLIDQLLDSAIQRRASDIHFEPYQHHYRVRMRIDGVLQEISVPTTITANRIAARLKILGNLNIAERRLPQDGQVNFQNQQRQYAMRIATLPVLAGEKVVLRLIETGQKPLDIEQLGMSEQVKQHYLQALHRPQGLVLVTGPTGSGKTVTLYSGLNVINHISRNICSIEDPVELPISGINQTQVNVKAGLVFSQALRAFLRQDPDIIMVGEIRDQETAQIAVEAAQTGHLVLSTLHTNSTIETLMRLSQIGIPAYQLVASLTLIIAQRLIRCLCRHCRIEQHASIKINLPYWQGEVKNWQAVGCEHCLNGYYGRTGLYEMLSITPEMKQAMLSSMAVAELQTLAIKQGMQPLFLAGIELVQRGVTTLAEVYRTLGQQGGDVQQLENPQVG